MTKINWVRMLVGGLVAAVILFITDGLFHENVVAADWKLVYNNLGIAEPQHTGLGVLYFAVFDLGRGLISIYLYVLMRACCGPGPKTAVWAGVVAWIAFSLTGPAQFVPLGFYSNALWLKVGAFQFFTSIVAAIAGAALYRQSSSTEVAT